MNFEDHLKEVLNIKLAHYLYNSSFGTSICVLKPKQVDCLLKIQKGLDVFCQLPTGYGKSLVFHIAKFLNPLDACILIISPLNAIINEQVQRLGKSAVNLNKEFLALDESEQRNILAQAFYIYGHPEAFLSKEFNSIYRCITIKHIIVDEAHCVVQWGPHFRPDYAKIGKIRSFFPESSFIAMTATATTASQKSIVASLGMKCPQIIKSTPVRSNIVYCVEKRPPNLVQDGWSDIYINIIQQLRDDPDNFPLTIMYSKLKWCGYGYNLAEQILKEDINVVTESGDVVKRVRQYHSPHTKEAREHVAKELQKKDSPLKLVLATVAYGMGADSPHIERVIHACPPTTLEELVQETGRAGRNGNQAVSKLLYNNNDIAKNVSGMSDEMRNYCTSQTCRREILNKHFGFQNTDFDQILPLCKCCDICSRNCYCSKCLSFCMYCSNISEQNCNDELDKTQNEVIETCLISYFRAENQAFESSPVSPELVTLLTDSLVKTITREIPCLHSPADISSRYNIRQDFARNIYHIICQITGEAD